MGWLRQLGQLSEPSSSLLFALDLYASPIHQLVYTRTVQLLGAKQFA